MHHVAGRPNSGFLLEIQSFTKATSLVFQSKVIHRVMCYKEKNEDFRSTTLAPSVARFHCSKDMVLILALRPGLSGTPVLRQV
jgi:hypothetical protein